MVGHQILAWQLCLTTVTELCMTAKNEDNSSEWRSKIGKLLEDGYNGGTIVMPTVPRKVAEYMCSQSPDSDISCSSPMSDQRLACAESVSICIPCIFIGNCLLDHDLAIIEQFNMKTFNICSELQYILYRNVWWSIKQLLQTVLQLYHCKEVRILIFRQTTNSAFKVDT